MLYNWSEKCANINDYDICEKCANINDYDTCEQFCKGTCNRTTKSS